MTFDTIGLNLACFGWLEFEKKQWWTRKNEKKKKKKNFSDFN